MLNTRLIFYQSKCDLKISGGKNTPRSELLIVYPSISKKFDF